MLSICAESMYRSLPDSGSSIELPVIPVTAGGAAQAMAALLTLVTVGHRALTALPPAAKSSDRNGAAPLSR